MNSARSTPTRAGRSGRGDHRRRLGGAGEDVAVAHLRRLGLEVVARNVRTRHGEIDAIAHGAGVLVFVEVKTRLSPDGARVSTPSEEPLNGLGRAQRSRLRRLATAWLATTRERPRAHTIRFDAIGVTLDRRGRLLRLDHIEGAW